MYKKSIIKKMIKDIELWTSTMRESKDYNLLMPIQNLCINLLKISDHIKYFPFHRTILSFLINLNDHAPRQNNLQLS